MRKILPDPEFPEVEIPIYDDDDEYEEQLKLYQKRIQKVRLRREEEERKKAEEKERVNRKAARERVGEKLSKRKADETTMKNASGKQLERAVSGHSNEVFVLKNNQMKGLHEILDMFHASPQALKSDLQNKKQKKTNLNQILGIMLPENEKCLSCHHGGIEGRVGWPCKVDVNHIKPQSCNTCSKRHKQCVWEGFEECAAFLKRKSRAAEKTAQWPSKKQKPLEQIWGQDKNQESEVYELIDDSDDELDVLVDIRDRVGSIVKQNELMLDLSNQQTQLLKIISDCSKINAFQLN